MACYGSTFTLMIIHIHQQMHSPGLQIVHQFQKTATYFDAILRQSQIQRSTSINTSNLEVQYQVLRSSEFILCDLKESSPCSICQCVPHQEVLYTVYSSSSNNATHEVLKRVDHKYINYLNSHTCFSPLYYHQVYHSVAPGRSSRFLDTYIYNKKISTIHPHH